MQQQMRRRGFTIGLLSLGLLAGVALTASPAQAATSNGPYYAAPAWDQKLAPATRFIVLTDWNSEAVLDRETGLVWEKSARGLASWNDARYTCINTNVGGRKGWRLPSIPELTSLIDPSVAPGPTLPPGHPFLNVQAVSYWSASTNAENPAHAWHVFFFNGIVGTADKTYGIQVWCVRGGMNADQY
jgi:hypothetical protein